MSSEHVRNFKVLIFEALTREANPILRDKLNEIAFTIAKTHFPEHFQETLAYSAHVLKKAAEDLKSGVFSANQMTLELLKTIREIFSEICKRGLLPNEEYFRQNFLTHVLPPLTALWSHFSEALMLGLSRTETPVLKLMLELDSLLVYTLRCGTPDALYRIVELRECARRLVLKSQAFMGLFKAEQKALAEQPEKLELAEQLAVVVTYELVFVMNQAPLVFGPFLEEYLALNLGLALRNFEWDSVLVRKACLLALYRTLRLQIHFGDRGIHLPRAPPDLRQLAVAANEAYGKVLDQASLQALFEVLLSRTMVVDEEDREGRLDLQIDDEEPDGLEHVTEELDCGIKKICLSLVEQLCMNFPDRTFGIIHGLAERLVLGTLNVEDRRTQDSIISVIGILPSRYAKQDVPKDRRIDGIVLLKWMGEKGADLVFFSRRFPLLLRLWLDLIDYETARQVLQAHQFVPVLLKLIQSQDIPTKFLCLTTLKSIVKAEKEGILPFEQILGTVVPAILEVCEKVTKPDLVWQAVSILTNIAERASLGAATIGRSFDLLSQLNLDKILANNDMLIKNALEDMFKSMVESAPLGTVLPGVYETAFRFLEHALPRIDPYECSSLELWLILVKDVPTAPQQAPAIDQHYRLLNRFVPSFKKFLQDEDQLQYLVKIVEESLLVAPEKISFE